MPLSSPTSAAMFLAVPLKPIGRQGSYEIHLELQEAASGVSRAERRSTTAALLGFLDEKARSDSELSEEHAQSMRYRQADVGKTTTSVAEEESLRFAELIGRRVRDIGDEYLDQLTRDPHFVSSVHYLVEGEATNQPERASEQFCEMVSTLFECNEDGVALKLSVGRIASLFSYCYHLCKVYLLKHGVKGILTFLGRILGCLIRCLYKSKFYEWLTSLGGWKQLLQQTYSGVVPRHPAQLVTPLVIAAALIFGLLAYRFYYRS